jgi:hypothetical protein
VNPFFNLNRAINFPDIDDRSERRAGFVTHSKELDPGSLSSQSGSGHLGFRPGWALYLTG